MVDLTPLTDDHQVIEAAVGQASRELARFASAPAKYAAALRGSVRELRDLLGEQVADEETQLFPAMRRYLPAEAYRWCEQQIRRKAGLSSLRFTVPWLARFAHPDERRRLPAAGGWSARVMLAAAHHRYDRLERRAFGAHSTDAKVPHR